MPECLALDLAQLSPRLVRLIEVKAREWACSPETAAIRLLDQAAASATRQQAATHVADTNASQLPSSGLCPSNTLTLTP